MLLQKTEKARLELSPGVRTLSLRERSLLLLADGKPLSDLQAMYNGIGAQIVENLMRQGYLTGPADLPPTPEPNTSNTTPTSTPSIERAVYDEGSRMLRGFLSGLAAHLAPGGEGWLVLSDLAEHLGLRPREQLLAWIAEAGLVVRGRHDVKPVHAKAADAQDALHAARAAEVTSLWRLAAA